MKQPRRPITAADVVDPAIACDPLQRQVSLPFKRQLFPLGFPLELSTNAACVLKIAEGCWGCWPHRIFAERGLQLHVAVSEGGLGAPPPSPTFRAQRNLVSIVADAHNYAVCDLNQGFAFAWINQDALADGGYLRYHFLEGIALTMLTARHVIPLHAACVERAGIGVLLCGNSGSGKSSLAFACARAGWKFLSDDASYLVVNSGRRVVGNPQRLRLRPSAKELFPEVRGLGLTPRPAGKPSIEIPTSQLAVDITYCATVEHIVFLNRRSGEPAALLDFPRQMAKEWARQSLVATLHEETDPADLDQLLGAKLHELRYDTLKDGIHCLETLERYA